MALRDLHESRPPPSTQPTTATSSPSFPHVGRQPPAPQPGTVFTSTTTTTTTTTSGPRPVQPDQHVLRPGYANLPRTNVPPAVAQQQRQFMSQWANNLHNEEVRRQRAAATAAAEGATAGTVPGIPTPPPPPPPQGRPMIVREGVSPSGTRWTFSTPAPADGAQQGPQPPVSAMTPEEIQRLTRETLADMQAGRSVRPLQHPFQGTPAPPSNPMQRSVSSASASQPQVRLSRTATPTSNGHPQPQPQSQSQPPPQVYLLSSPDGPSAILINGNQDAYYTPFVRRAVPPPASLYGSRLAAARARIPTLPIIPDPNPTVANPQGPRQRAAPNRNPNAQRQAVAPPHRNQAVRPGHPGNVVGPVALFAHMWPHIWLVMRLFLFIWWFTSPETSWTRWSMLVSLALGIFVMNIGLLDAFAQQAWDPIRRYFEHMVPPNARHRERRQRQQAQGARDRAQPADAAAQQAPAAARQLENAGAQGARREPHPAGMAARLVERRRDADDNWIQDQIRRVQRAGLLFLASLAPGIAERHIRQEADRARREAAAVEAARIRAAEADEAQDRESATDAGEQDSAPAEAPGPQPAPAVPAAAN